MSSKDVYVLVPNSYLPKVKSMKGKQILVTLDDEFLEIPK